MYRVIVMSPLHHFIAFVLLQPEDKSVESDEGFELVDWPYPPPEQVTTPTS